MSAARATSEKKEPKATEVVTGYDPETGEPIIAKHLYVVPETGVQLDKNDPNYQDLLEIEKLRAQIAKARAGAVEEGLKQDEEVRAAGIRAEKARLALELAEVQSAAKATTASDNTIAQIEAQAAESERLAEAVAPGKDS